MESNKKWDIEITPNKKWYELNLREVVRYRDLIRLLVKRDFAVQYKQTVLGPLWFILNPLITTVISTIIFSGIAHIDSDGIPYFLFYLAGFTLWNYFSTCVSTTSTTFTQNANIMGKVYFPRLTMAISSVIFAGINMVVVLAITIISMVFFRIGGTNISPSWTIIFLPILILQTAFLGLGVGIIVSSLTTKYRDLVILVSFGLQLWMYITPVVYPLSQVSGTLRTLILLNPMSSVIQNFRYALLGCGSFEVMYWIISLGLTAVLFLIGVLLFNNVEKTFMDTV